MDAQARERNRRYCKAWRERNRKAYNAYLRRWRKAKRAIKYLR